MKFSFLRPMFTIALAALTAFSPINSHAETSRFDELANAKFEENRPTAESAQMLRDELLFQRATQAYLWALPLINTLGMKEGSEKTFGAGYNVLPVWKKRLDAKTLVTTPNSDVIYAMGYVDLGKDGPIVFEAPPGLQGILLDFWQRPIPVDGGKFAGDVGLPGPDGGKGGKFLILPPGYDGEVPEGYFVYRSETNNVFIFLRAFYQDPANTAPAVALIGQSKIYPLKDKDDAKAMVFPDASGVPVDMLPASDGRAFDQLKRLVDSEDANLADADGLGLLASIGIIKGKPFDPDAKTRAILDRAAKTGYKTSRVVAFEEELGGRSLRIYPDRRWINPMADITPDGSGVEKSGGRLSRSRRAHLVFQQLLLGQSRHGLADPGEGRDVYDRFHGQPGRRALGWERLPSRAAAEHPGRQFLVGHALRGGKRIRSGQRAAVPVARFARQAGHESRRQHGTFPRSASARGQGG